MKEHSWQQDFKVSKTKNKPITQQKYDEDFQSQTNKKIKQNNSIELPKIQQKGKLNQRSNNKHIKTKISDDQQYQNDFQVSSIKKLEQKQNKRKLFDKNINKAKSKKQKQSPSNFKNNNKSLEKDKVKDQDQINNRLSLQQGLQNHSQVPYESKYLYYLKNEFPHSKEQVQKFQPQKINRLNERLKNYIKKVNDQLTDLINENMRILKANSSKQNVDTRSVEDQIKMLNQQKRSSQVYFQTLQKECKKLVDKQGLLKQQQVQLKYDTQIQQIKQQIKDHTKQIYNLKLGMHNQGNKLTEEKNWSERLTQVKNKLILIKKQEQKNNQKNQKYNKNFQQLNTKSLQIQTQLEKLSQQAKRQNIKIIFNPQERKKTQKYDELKKKLQNLKSYKDKSLNLTQTKVNILKKDNDSLKNEISQIQNRFKQIDNSISFAQQNSKQLIVDSKNKNLEPYIQAHLEFIYKNIIDDNSLNNSNCKFTKSGKQKALQERNIKYGLKKYSSVTNAHVYARSQSQAQTKPSFHITKKSPLLLQTKQKNVLKLSEKQTQQRIWKQSQSIKKQATQIALQPKIYEGQSKDLKKLKPFSTKRSANSVSGTIEIQLDQSQNKNNLSLNKNQKQNQKSSLLGPKNMFKKSNDKVNQLQSNMVNPIKKNENENEKINVIKKDELNRRDSKSSFKIKKAIKQKVDIPDQDLYLFPPEENEIKSEEMKQKINEIGNQKKEFNINSKGPNFKISKNIGQNKNLTIENKGMSLQNKNSPTQKKEQVLQRKNQTLQSQNNKEKENGPEKFPEDQIKLKVRQSKEEEINNFVGRRQVQRKIQRKSQQSYGV